MWIHPRAAYTYIQSPFRGTGQLDPERVEQVDGTCTFCWPTKGVGDSITGSRVFDAVLGAVAGLAVANKKYWQYYMGAGAIGALVLGWPALAATTGVALVQRKELFKEMLG
jgi:hypothetical protein